MMLDTEKDHKVWSGQKNYLESHGSCNRWKDFYVHKCKDGSVVYYMAHRTLWQGERNYIELITKDEAQRFAEENYGDLEYDDETLKSWGLIDLDQVE